MYPKPLRVYVSDFHVFVNFDMILIIRTRTNIIKHQHKIIILNKLHKNQIKPIIKYIPKKQKS